MFSSLQPHRPTIQKPTPRVPQTTIRSSSSAAANNKSSSDSSTVTTETKPTTASPAQGSTPKS
ncbi:hypothetical protein TWF281_007824 [Arthrobotrys megalospora]